MSRDQPIQDITVFSNLPEVFAAEIQQKKNRSNNNCVKAMFASLSLSFLASFNSTVS